MLVATPIPTTSLTSTSLISVVTIVKEDAYHTKCFRGPYHYQMALKYLECSKESMKVVHETVGVKMRKSFLIHK